MEEPFRYGTLKAGEYVEKVCENSEQVETLTSWCERKTESEWREKVVMNFIVPQSGIVGFWRLETHGAASSIHNLVNTYDTIKENAGQITGVPFSLSVKKVKSWKPGSKSSYPVLKPCTLAQTPERTQTLRNAPRGAQKLAATL